MVEEICDTASGGRYADEAAIMRQTKEQTSRWTVLSREVGGLVISEYVFSVRFLCRRP